MFDRLAADVTIETARDADLDLVFRTGHRFRLRGGSRARLEPGRATTLAGTVEALSPVPTVPLVTPVTGAGTTITAVRIRAGGIAIVGPDRGEKTLADATVLEFAPVPAGTYDIEVEAPDATVVFRTQAAHTRVEVPPGALQAGVAYRWRVKARLPSGFEGSGEGRFATLGADDAAAREDLRRALSAAEPSASVLLAEVDWTLGLLREALAQFREAEREGVADPVIRERIVTIERAMAGSGPVRQER